MDSFKLHAVGNLARNPELVAKSDTLYTRFCLVGNDYAGRDEEGAAREVVTTLWFVAFGSLGEAIAKNVRKGDQLIVEARVRSSDLVVSVEDDGRGFDVEKLRAASHSTGIVTDEEAVQAAFIPGVTTSPVVTVLSGRGIGLDVVRKRIEDLRGAIAQRALGRRQRDHVFQRAAQFHSGNIVVRIQSQRRRTELLLDCQRHSWPRSRGHNGCRNPRRDLRSERRPTEHAAWVIGQGGDHLRHPQQARLLETLRRAHDNLIPSQQGGNPPNNVPHMLRRSHAQHEVRFLNRSFQARRHHHVNRNHVVR